MTHAPIKFVMQLIEGAAEGEEKLALLKAKDLLENVYARNLSTLVDQITNEAWSSWDAGDEDVSAGGCDFSQAETDDVEDFDDEEIEAFSDDECAVRVAA